MGCADAIQRLCAAAGVTRNKNLVSLALLEHCCRTSLDPLARRAMVVTKPLRVVLLNVDASEVLPPVPNHPKDASMGTRPLTLTRTIYISADDFSLEPPAADFFGLALGKQVHLKYAFNLTADRVVMEADGTTIKEVHATVDRSNATKCKGKLTWVASAVDGARPLEVELRLYDKLFLSADPSKSNDWLADLNPDSLRIVSAYAEASLAQAVPGDHVQFERMGFFVCDKDSTAAGKLVFNRTVALR
jgi:glutaminyl-tRNA synthetase